MKQQSHIVYLHTLPLSQLQESSHHILLTLFFARSADATDSVPTDHHAFIREAQNMCARYDCQPERMVGHI